MKTYYCHKVMINDTICIVSSDILFKVLRDIPEVKDLGPAVMSEIPGNELNELVTGINIPD